MVQISSPSKAIATRNPLSTPVNLRGAAVWQLLRYVLSCGSVLALKVILTSLLIRWTSPMLAYVLVHVVTFFVSYALHTRLTFNVAFSWVKLRQYFAAVIGFKLLDYLLFAVLFAAFQIDAVLAVLLASLLIFATRFVVVRRILVKAAPNTLEANRV